MRAVWPLAVLSLCVSGAEARLFSGRGSTSPEVSRSETKRGGPKRILMLISDTGGGHRASANAVNDMFQQLRPKQTEVKVVDIWTEHGAWPYNKLAAGYPWLCRHPPAWRFMYFASCFRGIELPWLVWTHLTCGHEFRKCMSDFEPDMVVSFHPLCQNLPIVILDKLRQTEPKWPQALPFAVVCTDLGSAHPSWFRKEVDACFVPSEAVKKIALRRGVLAERIKQYGLPVRPAFWKITPPTAKDGQFKQLGLEPDKKTVLVIGGGDGVGNIGEIVDATAKRLSRDTPGAAQVVAICGKNEVVKQQLLKKKADGAWSGVDVEVQGFTNRVSSYMEVADCVVTKAGPGTIAEAAIRGLPTLLSSFLPGQEAGNVPFVIENGFGEYARKPADIASTVSSWLQDDAKLKQMSTAAREASAPDATKLIAQDLLKLLDTATANNPAQ